MVPPRPVSQPRGPIPCPHPHPSPPALPAGPAVRGAGAERGGECGRGAGPGAWRAGCGARGRERGRPGGASGSAGAGAAAPATLSPRAGLRGPSGHPPAACELRPGWPAGPGTGECGRGGRAARGTACGRSSQPEEAGKAGWRPGNRDAAFVSRRMAVPSPIAQQFHPLATPPPGSPGPLSIGARESPLVAGPRRGRARRGGRRVRGARQVPRLLADARGCHAGRGPRQAAGRPSGRASPSSRLQRGRSEQAWVRALQLQPVV